MRKKIVILYFVIMALAVGAFGQYPKWAQDQLYLRGIIRESIRQTQEWQKYDGALYPYLNLYKWDDEVEIFYFWLEYYYLTGDQTVYQSVKDIALKYIERAEQDNQFDHGYYRDAFFDTEHTLEGMIILASLAWAHPDDQDIIDALVDVVEHAANLIPDYRTWYVEEMQLMRSVRLGTQKVEKNKSSAVDWVFNLQFVKMALAAYHANGDARLLDWSKDYLDGWIDVMRINEKDNGYYLLPSSVDPYTGQIGPYSGVWWQSSFEPGWGWPEKGNNANRDMRGAFLDCYTLSGEKRFLTALRKHVQTLFDNGTADQPAHIYDGQKWYVETDKVTVGMAAGVSLLDEAGEAEFDDFMWRWYNYVTYPYPEQHFWAYQKAGGLDKVDAINKSSIDNAQNRLDEIKALTALPEEPDDFPSIGGHWGITLVPFGGISGQRGEMPWKEILYYKSDKSLGLYDGVAALFESQTDSSKSIYLCNTTNQSYDMWIQSGYIEEPIKCLFVDGDLKMSVEGGKARLRLPAQHTLHVQIINKTSDVAPPSPVQLVTLFGR